MPILFSENMRKFSQNIVDLVMLSASSFQLPSFLEYRNTPTLKVQLNLSTRTNFIVGCIVNFFGLYLGSAPGFFVGEIKVINYSSDSEIGSNVYA